MLWLLGLKFKLSLENKTLIYKCMLKPIWTYGIQLWGRAKPSNTKIIQRLPSNVLRTITNAPWYVSNFTLHNDLQIPFITEEIKGYLTIYYNRLIGHENSYVTELSNPLNWIGNHELWLPSESRIVFTVVVLPVARARVCVCVCAWWWSYDRNMLWQ
jgi:hypothetical protein